MNLLGFLVLSILNGQDADNRLCGMTLKDITDAENLGCKVNTIYKQLQQFIVSGYVDHGAKDGHANTYYITNFGKEYLEKEKLENEK